MALVGSKSLWSPANASISARFGKSDVTRVAGLLVERDDRRNRRGDELRFVDLLDRDCRQQRVEHRELLGAVHFAKQQLGHRWRAESHVHRAPHG